MMSTDNLDLMDMDEAILRKKIMELEKCLVTKSLGALPIGNLQIRQTAKTALLAEGYQTVQDLIDIEDPYLVMRFNGIGRVGWRELLAEMKSFGYVIGWREVNDAKPD